MVTEPLSMWVIYERPRDYPEYFVVRRWRVDRAGASALEACALVASLADAREHVPRGAVNIGREPEDDPVIVESWV